MLRRIGAIGDIHGEDASVASVLAFFATQGLDAIVAVGDIVDGGRDAERCCHLLRDVGVQVVVGNHERWFLRDEMRMLRDITPREALSEDTRAWLATLPKTRTFETAAGELLLCHGAGENDMEAVYPDEPEYIVRQRTPVEAILAMGDVDIVIGGHTHQRMVRRIDHVTFVNAGTLRPEDSPCCAVLDLEKREVAFFDVVANEVCNPQFVPFPVR